MGDRSALYNYDALWREVYGDIQLYGPGHRHLCRLAAQWLNTLSYRSVVDVGCGMGHHYRLLTKQRPDIAYLGVDIAESALDRARSQTPGSYRRHDIERAPLEGQWDLVFCSLVLEHLHDDAAALRHLRAMTRQHVFLTSIAGDFERYRPWEESQGHLRNYAVGELEDKVNAAGFHVTKTMYWGYPFYSPLVRLAQNVSRVGTGAYTWRTRLIAHTLNALYYLNSSRRGDVIYVLASV